MNARDIFATYGEPKEVTPESVERWATHLSTLVGSLNTESTSTVEQESKIRKAWETTPIAEDLSNLFEQFSADLFAIIGTNGPDATHAYMMLRSLTSDVKEERDYHVTHEARLTKPRATVGEGFETSKADAAAIKDHIENLHNLAGMGMFDWPDSVKVKTLKDGSVKPDLPRIPSGPREGGGRKSATSNLRLTVDGTTYDDNTVSSVCHDILSDGGFRISAVDLRKQVEERGHKFFTGWDEPVTVNGYDVTGHIITASSDEEEADEEE